MPDNVRTFIKHSNASFNNTRTNFNICSKKHVVELYTQMLLQVKKKPLPKLIGQFANN